MHVLYFDHLCCNAIILLLYCLNSQAVKQKTNLLYSLPTSSGKTMVAEIVMLQVAFLSQKLTTVVMINDEVVGVLAESLHLVIDQWIQYKLGKQYL